MKNYFKNQFETISSMSSIERNSLLCQLSVKKMFNTISLDEILQFEIIQAIRTANGEIYKVLKNWEENPELDPRN